MYLAPKTSHGSFVPASRHKGANVSLEAPRSPSFNEADVSDKPAWVRRQRLLGSAGDKKIDET
jgi:hypothetical protein